MMESLDGAPNNLAKSEWNRWDGFKCLGKNRCAGLDQIRPHVGGHHTCSSYWHIWHIHIRVKAAHDDLRPLPQVVPIPRPFSRRHSHCCPAATASSISTVHLQTACYVPAAHIQRGAWTVAVVTAGVRWCASVLEAGGWFMVSRLGATPAGHNGHPASTPKSRPSARGSGRWLDGWTDRPDRHDPINIGHWWTFSVHQATCGQEWTDRAASGVIKGVITAVQTVRAALLLLLWSVARFRVVSQTVVVFVVLQIMKRDQTHTSCNNGWCDISQTVQLHLLLSSLLFLFPWCSLFYCDGLSQCVFGSQFRFWRIS